MRRSEPGGCRGSGVEVEIRQGAPWEGLVVVPQGVVNTGKKVRRRGVTEEVKPTGRGPAAPGSG